MSDLPIQAAIERLNTGFLGAEYRRALRNLLVTTGRTAESGAMLPTPVLAAYIAAVEVLGDDAFTGGAR